MLVRGELGLSPLVSVVVILGVFVIIVLVIRRKWRLAAARREEIKRLLVLASEESARAELEATFGYGTVAKTTTTTTNTVAAAPPSQLQHQCAVCFCPTTKLCKRCKAVRYWYDIILGL